MPAIASRGLLKSCSAALLAYTNRDFRVDNYDGIFDTLKRIQYLDERNDWRVYSAIASFLVVFLAICPVCYRKPPSRVMEAYILLGKRQ